MRRRVYVQVRVPPHERDHLVDPGPTAETADDLELWEVHRDLVEMSRVAEVVGPVVRIVHRRIDPNGNAELGSLGVERVVTAIARRNAIDERGHAEGLESLGGHEPFQLTPPPHPLERID